MHPCMQHATVYRLPAGSAAPTELSDGKELKFDEPAYSLGPGSQGDFASDILRFYYGSLTTPPTTIDHNMISGQRWGRFAISPYGSLSHVPSIACSTSHKHAYIMYSATNWHVEGIRFLQMLGTMYD